MNKINVYLNQKNSKIMRPIFQYIISQSLIRKFNKRKEKLRAKQLEKELENTQIEIKHVIKDAFLIIIGVFAAGFGLQGFLLPNMFIDGGVTGISLIVTELTSWPLSVLLILINLPFIILAYYNIGRLFAIKSIFGIMLLAIVVHFLPYPIITEDKLLISVFGGFFLGLGIGLAVRGGAVIDGTEVLAIFVSKKSSLTIGDVILIFNVFIFGVAAYVFSVETALYAMLTYLVASKTVDFVVSGIEEYVGVSIISEQSDEIRLSIIENLGRGCTIYNGKRGYAKQGEPLKEIDIVYTVVTRLELAELNTEIEKIDANAFVTMQSIKDAKGGMIKRRPLD